MANRVLRVVAAVIERDGKYLITQRRDEAVLPGLWEFPGGRVEAGETDEGALHREVLGRIGVEVEVGDRVAQREHEYDGYTVHLSMFACKLDPPGAEPHARSVKEIRWVGSGEFGEYKFPPADQATMDQLLEVKRWP
jgi:8-oxo-dGTP diphosphatase